MASTDANDGNSFWTHESESTPRLVPWDPLPQIVSKFTIALNQVVLNTELPTDRQLEISHPPEGVREVSP
eukprot:4816378-Ditylum_brightwellii.AAC.1